MGTLLPERTGLPLPEGEGRGEGERDIRMLSNRPNIKSQKRWS